MDAATFLLFLGLYFWGADLYIHLHQPPADALRDPRRRQAVDVEDPASRRRSARSTSCTSRSGEPVRLVMTSQDVIHSFFIPAFRIKQDVLPGRYDDDVVQRRPRPASYQLFCAEFCGTDHAHMGGTVIVMEPADYAALARQPGTRTRRWPRKGAALFRQYRLQRLPRPRQHRPRAVAGGPVRPPGAAWPTGRMVTADERYIRDSILLPKARIAAGYPAIMPSFDGQIGEEDL